LFRPLGCFAYFLFYSLSPGAGGVKHNGMVTRRTAGVFMFIFGLFFRCLHSLDWDVISCCKEPEEGAKQQSRKEWFAYIKARAAGWKQSPTSLPFLCYMTLFSVHYIIVSFLTIMVFFTIHSSDTFYFSHN
jgi:hypothetical protein